jgi:uncharacterized membrane protein YjjP (DUF1212 family)
MPGLDKAVNGAVAAIADETRSVGLEVQDAVQAALIVLENGGTTGLAERTFNNVLAGFQKSGVAAIWRIDYVSVAATLENGYTASLVTPVGPIGFNLTRVLVASDLGEQVAKHPLAPATLAHEIERIRTLPTPHNRWVMALAAAGAGAFFAKTAAGDSAALVICAAAAGTGQFLRSLFQTIGLSRASATFLSAFCSGLLAMVGIRLGLTQTTAATLLGSVIYTVPGLLLINGFLDLTTERHLVVGSERLLHALFLFFVVTIAIASVDALL